MTHISTPEISVIVPVYKTEQYLEKCVRSILEQTFEDFELILVDDGSPDHSGELCDKLALKDARIKVFHKQNGGLSSARNCGMDHAAGTYIMFCDSDDYVMPKWIESLHNLIIKKDIELGICGISGSNMTSSDCCTEICNIEVLSKTEYWELYKENLMKSVWNKIYIQDIIRSRHIRFDESLKIAEDQPFNFKYISCIKNKFGLDRTALYVYRCNLESLSHSYAANLWNVEKEIKNELKDTIIQCKIDFNAISPQYYGMYIDTIDRCLRNNMRPGSGRTFMDRFLENCRILRSQECKTAMKKGDFPSMNPVYRLCLKTRLYPLVWLYQATIPKMKKLRKICQ